MNKDTLIIVGGIILSIVVIYYAINMRTQNRSTQREVQTTTSSEKNATTSVNLPQERELTHSTATTSSPSVNATQSIKSPSAVSKPKPVVVASQSATATRIVIKDYSFAPTNLTIKKGTTLTWTNQDIAKHTVTADNGSFGSQFFGKDETFRHTFTEAGTFDYHCEPHPYMKAKIIVIE